MRRRRIRYSLAVLVLAVVLTMLHRLGVVTTPSAPPPAAGTEAVVARVIDGDTIVLAGGEHVRYIGVDSPEMRPRRGGGPEPFARQAAAANARLVDGRRVRLVYDRDRRDRYNRLLAYVYVHDTFVNLAMVEQGMARAKAYPPNTAHQAVFSAAEARARGAGRGLWNWEGQ